MFRTRGPFAAISSFAALAVCATASLAQDPIKICPLGDSIIESYDGKASARYYLDQQLRNAGYSFDFVGHNHGVFGGVPADPNFDQDHEAYSGWKLDDVLPQLHGWMSDTVPDIVLIHLGTNDMLGFQTEASSVQELEQCVNVIRSVNPYVTIMISKLIKMTWRDVNYLNVLLPDLVAAIDTPQSRVVLIDHYTGFDLNNHLQGDGVHPNDDGERFMAGQWFHALTQFMTPSASEASRFGSGCSGSAPSAPTLSPVRGQAASLGNALVTRLGSLPNGAVPYAFIGIDANSFAGHPLPFSLDQLGAPGCQLLVGPLATVPLVESSNEALLTLEIAQDSALIGSSFCVQGACVAPTLNALGMTLSDAIEITVLSGN